MKKRSVLCFLVSIALGIFRIFVVKSSVEPEKGFYVKGSVMPYVFTGLCAAALIVFAVYSLRFRKKAFAPDIRCGAVGVISTGLFAVALVWCGAIYLVGGHMIKGIIALLCGCSLVVAAPAHAMKDNPPFLSVALLIPCLWCGVSLMSTFRSFSTIITISDYLLESLALTAMLLFAFYAAKAYLYQDTSALVHFAAFTAFLGVFVTALPSLYFSVTKDAVFSVPFSPDLIVLASMLVYAPMTIYAIEKHEV